MNEAAAQRLRLLLGVVWMGSAALVLTLLLRFFVAPGIRCTQHTDWTRASVCLLGWQVLSLGVGLTGVAWWFHLEHRVDTLRINRRWWLLPLGVLGGGVVFGVPAALGVSLGQISLRQGSGDGVASTLLLLALLALNEELIFRGYLLSALERLLSPLTALCLVALLFGLAHAGNPGASPMAFTGVTMAGLVLGRLVQVTGSLWSGWGAHLGWNLCQAVLLGFPVSGFHLPTLYHSGVLSQPYWWGGRFGPEEGAAWILALALVAGLLLRLSTKALHQTPGPGGYASSDSARDEEEGTMMDSGAGPSPM